MSAKDRILAMDIGASGVKLAEFVALKAGGVELVNYAVGSLELDPLSETDRSTYIETTIRELMRDHGIKPGPVQLSISGQSVFLRFVKLPPVAKEKVYQIILYEAQQNVPFPIQEVVWDYQLIGSGEGELDVMLAAIKADLVEQLTASVEVAGLTPDLIDVAPMALYNAVRYNYPQLPACTLVVDMGARSTDLIFIEQGRVFSRSIPVAGNAITQQIMQEFDLPFAAAEEMKCAHAFVAFGGAYEGAKSEVVDKVSKSVRSVMTRLHAEINRSINFYRSQQAGQQPELVLITGGSSIIPYTDTFLKEKMKVEVDFLNPFLNVTVSDGIEAEQIGQHAHLLGEVVGLALRQRLSCPIEINLLPPRLVAEKAFKKKQPVLILAAVGVLCLVAVWCFYLLRMTGLSQQRLDQIQQQVTALEQVEGRMQGLEQQEAEVRRKMDKLLALLPKRTAWLEVLDQVHASLLPGMWLTEVKPLTAADLKVGEGAAASPAQPWNNPAAARPAAETAPAIVALELTGWGYRDEGSPIIGFRDQLRRSAFFTPATEIIRQPALTADAFAAEFKVRVVLKNPLDI